MRSRDKDKQKEYARKHYLANKEKVHERTRINTAKVVKDNKEFIKSYLKSHPCVDCGESDIIVLEFDHVRGQKYRNISEMVPRGVCLERIKEEIDKCEVRCANCHRRITHKRRIGE